MGDELSPRDRLFFGAYMSTLVAGLQVIAWVMGHNGAIFATTTAIIGGIAGALLGFSINLKKS